MKGRACGFSFCMKMAVSLRLLGALAGAPLRLGRGIAC